MVYNTDCHKTSIDAAYAFYKKRPIQITTLGSFSIRLHGTNFSDRRWLGSRTMKPLKFLIALGGESVSANRMISLLWPDNDLYSGMRNLKVALVRLRKIWKPVIPSPVSWIIVKNQTISLNPRLCHVDSLSFSHFLHSAYADNADVNALAFALNLYTDDFLPDDVFEDVIINKRNQLCHDYIKAVVRLSEMCLTKCKPELCVTHLENALKKGDHHEMIFAHLMRAYIKMGYPSQAFKIYNDAKIILNKKYGIKPGSVLSSILHSL